MASSSDIRAGRAYVELSVKDSLSKGLRRAQQKLQTFGRSLQTVGKTFTIVGGFATAMGAAVLGALVPAVSAASDLNEVVSKTGEIFGKRALPALEAFAEGAAESLGQSKVEALNAAATFATFGKSAGLAGDDLVGFSKELTVLASDLASFHNSSPEEAVTAIGAALRGESEPLRRFGVLLDDATLRAEAFAQGIIDSTKNALTPQQKVLAAHAVIMRQTVDAQGDFARTSDGLANSQRILQAQWKDLKAIIGQSLLEPMTAVVKKASQLMGVFKEWATRNQELIVGIARVAAGVVAAGAALMALGIGIIGAGGVLSAIGTGFGMIATAITALMTPIGAVVGALALTGIGLGAAVIAVARESEDFRQVFVNGLGEIATTATTTGKAISDAFKLGDTQAAWDVAMQGLEVAWLQTLNSMLIAYGQFMIDITQMTKDNAHTLARDAAIGAAGGPFAPLLRRAMGLGEASGPLGPVADTLQQRVDQESTRLLEMQQRLGQRARDEASHRAFLEGLPDDPFAPTPSFADRNRLASPPDSSEAPFRFGMSVEAVTNRIAPVRAPGAFLDAPLSAHEQRVAKAKERLAQLKEERKQRAVDAAMGLPVQSSMPGGPRGSFSAAASMAMFGGGGNPVKDLVSEARQARKDRNKTNGHLEKLRDEVKKMDMVFS